MDLDTFTTFENLEGKYRMKIWEVLLLFAVSTGDPSFERLLYTVDLEGRSKIMIY
jgi:hypothetical protein